MKIIKPLEWEFRTLDTLENQYKWYSAFGVTKSYCISNRNMFDGTSWMLDIKQVTTEGELEQLASEICEDLEWAKFKANNLHAADVRLYMEKFIKNWYINYDC